MSGFVMTHPPTITSNIDCFALLPNELLLKILGLCDSKFITRCRAICKRFQVLIDTAPELQYAIELDVSGLECLSHTPSVTERLRSLQGIQISQTECCTRDGYSPQESPILTMQGSEASYQWYKGNVLFSAARLNQSINVPRKHPFFDTLICHSIHTSTVDPQQLPFTRTWSHTFPFLFVSFDADPAQDVLLLYQVDPSNIENMNRKYEKDQAYTMHIVRISDGSFYPQGPITIPIIPRMWTYRRFLQFKGDIVGFTIPAINTFLGHAGSIWILNWRSDQVVLDWECKNQWDRKLRHAAFNIISDSCFLVSAPHFKDERKMYGIEVYTFDKDTCVPLTSPVRMATHVLPRIREDTKTIHDVDIYLSHFTCGKYPGDAKEPCFVPKPSHAIVLAEILVWDDNLIETRRNEGCVTYCAKVFIQASTFLKSVALYKKQYSQKKPLYFPWNAWGPTATRCFPWHADSGSNMEAIYGTRYFWDNNIFDFNASEIKRDLVRAGFDLFTVTTENTGDNPIQIPSCIGDIFIQPSVVPRGDYFEEDVVSSLPYRKFRAFCPFDSNSTDEDESVVMFVRAGDPWVQLKRTYTWDMVTDDGSGMLNTYHVTGPIE